MNTKLIIPVLGLTALLGATIIGVRTVAAETSAGNSSIVSKLASKFNLKTEDVQSVFEAERNERQQEMLKLREEKLGQAVTAGVITEAQKTALISKMQQQQELMEKHRTEMQQWFTDQGIDQDKLAPYWGGGHMGIGRGMGMGGPHGGF